MKRTSWLAPSGSTNMKRDYPFIIIMAVVWSIIIAVIVAMAFKAHAQIAPGALHRLIGNPVASSSGWPDPSGANKLEHWWVGSDLTNSPISSWTNRITIGSVLRTNGVNDVTWTTDHVNLVGNINPLQAFPLLGFDGRYTPTTNGGCVAIIFSQNQSTTTGEILVSTNGLNLLDVLSDGATLRWEGTQVATIPKNVVFDFIYNADGYCWTNGIATTLRGGLGAHLGFSGVSRLKGSIYEILIWTNGPLTSGQISNFHYYATNTYKYSP